MKKSYIFVLLILFVHIATVQSRVVREFSNIQRASLFDKYYRRIAYRKWKESMGYIDDQRNDRMFRTANFNTFDIAE